MVVVPLAHRVIAGVVTKYAARLVGTEMVTPPANRKFTAKVSPGWMSAVVTRGWIPIPQPCGRSPSIDRSGPATTKPRSSRSTTPSSQSVSGAAPMNRNSHCASAVSVAPVEVSRSVRRSRWSLPSAAMTSVQVRTEMLPISLICWIR